MSVAEVAPLLAEAAGVATGTALLLRLPPLSPSRSQAYVRAVAVASASGAALSGASPTGTPAVDVVALAALGAACVLLGVRVAPLVLLAGAVAGVVGTAGSGVQVPALATTGLLVAAVAGSRPWPIVRALACAGIAQVVLRLTYPRSAGATAVLAFVVLAPMLIGGARRLPPPSRRLLMAASAVCGTVFILGTVFAGLAALGARPSMDRGLAAARAALTAVDEGRSEDASVQLSRSRDAFSDASDRLGRWWARPVAAVPLVGQQWHALRAAASSGRDVAAVGALTMSVIDRVREIRVENGVVALDDIATATPAVVRASDTLATARRRLDRVDSPWLLPQVGRPFQRHRERLARAQDSAGLAGRTLTALPGLLGADAPRRYFLAVLTPSELRGAGGYMGNWGEITADRGRLALTRFGRTSDLNRATDPLSRRLVAPRDYLERYGRHRPEWYWGNVPASPDFPTVAEVLAQLYPQSGGEPVDGVIAVGPYGMAAILRLVGPVEVPGWPEPLTAESVAPVLLHEQYLRFPGGERADFLGEVTEQLWRRLTTSRLPAPAAVLQALGPAVEEKRLQLASMREPEQRLFEDLEADGAMAPVDGDFLAVVTQNGGTNKIDWFLRRQMDYRARLDPTSGRIESELDVVLRNDGPLAPLPGGVNDSYTTPPVAPGSNALHLSVYTPWALQEARVDGAPVPFEAAEELGRRVYSAFLVVPAQGSVHVELRFTGRLVSGGYRMDLHRQPTVTPDEVRTGISLPSGWRTDEGRREWSWEGPLDADRTVGSGFERR